MHNCDYDLKRARIEDRACKKSEELREELVEIKMEDFGEIRPGNIWTLNDKELFARGIKAIGKNFNQIKKELVSL